MRRRKPAIDQKFSGKVFSRVARPGPAPRRRRRPRVPPQVARCYRGPARWLESDRLRRRRRQHRLRVFHKLDETIRGHAFCSFLALVLKKALEDRIAARGRSSSWPEIIADLDSLIETEIAQDGKRFIVRSAPRPAASLALRAAGVALPPTVREAAG